MNRPPRSADEHVAQNAEAIEAAAQEYAKAYGCSIEDARRDVADEYRQGWSEDVAADVDYSDRDEPVDHAYNEGDRADRYGSRES